MAEQQIIESHISPKQYVAESTAKRSIFLHHSAGSSVKSMLDWWNNTKERVACSYAIDRDGKIYEAFPSRFWAYHLGIKGDDDWQEKHSIGIEIISMGGLTKTPAGWKAYTNRVIPFNEVWEVPKGESYRGYQGFQKYTPKSIDSLVWLIKHLMSKHPDIKIQEEGLWGFWDYDQDVIKKHKSGLYSHTTVRKDKSDIFPQSDLIEKLMFNFS